MRDDKLAALIQESLSVATRTGAAKPADFSKVIVDTTVQPKAVAFLNRRQADVSRPRTAGAAAEETRREAAPVLRARRQTCADRPSALRPRQTVQARRPGVADDPNLSRP